MDLASAACSIAAGLLSNLESSWLESLWLQIEKIVRARSNRTGAHPDLVWNNVFDRWKICCLYVGHILADWYCRNARDDELNCHLNMQFEWIFGRNALPGLGKSTQVRRNMPGML